MRSLRSGDKKAARGRAGRQRSGRGGTDLFLRSLKAQDAEAEEEGGVSMLTR